MKAKDLINILEKHPEAEVTIEYYYEDCDGELAEAEIKEENITASDYGIIIYI
jgi:hypothetical protein